MLWESFLAYALKCMLPLDDDSFGVPSSYGWNGTISQIFVYSALSPNSSQGLYPLSLLGGWFTKEMSMNGPRISMGFGPWVLSLCLHSYYA